MVERALVLFSGGQDSTTCLAWALDRFDEVQTVGFAYGQRHAIELECRTQVLKHFALQYPQWAPKIGRDHLHSIDAIKEISSTSLTHEMDIKMNANGLPSTFVPGRNLLFFTFAAAIAYREGITHLVGGMCETDYSGYPDCRDDTLKALQSALNLGMDSSFAIHTPLMWLDKSQTWALAETLGGENLVKLIMDDTHTCYLGERGMKNAWGYGCGTCPACDLRRKGFVSYKDKL